MTTKEERRLKIKRGIRGKVSGTPECPRLTVFRSNKQIYAQVIDDTTGKTLAAASSLKLDVKAPKKEIAAKVDAMIIIGGRHSSNTRKLYEICSRECADTYFIQTLDDLHLDLPKSVRLVGITAGASTPNKIIEEVQNYVRINF